MTTRSVTVMTFAAVFCVCAPSRAQDTAKDTRPVRLAGEKLDSGLGSLPHYREWRDLWTGTAPKMSGRLNPVQGEKLDSGLGEVQRYHASNGAPALLRTASK